MGRPVPAVRRRASSLQRGTSPRRHRRWTCSRACCFWRWRCSSAASRSSRAPCPLDVTRAQPFSLPSSSRPCSAPPPVGPAARCRRGRGCGWRLRQRRATSARTCACRPLTRASTRSLSTASTSSRWWPPPCASTRWRACARRSARWSPWQCSSLQACCSSSPAASRRLARRRARPRSDAACWRVGTPVGTRPGWHAWLTPSCL